MESGEDPNHIVNSNDGMIGAAKNYLICLYISTTDVDTLSLLISERNKFYVTVLLPLALC